MGRILGTITKKEVAEQNNTDLVRWLLFYACADDDKHSKTAYKAVAWCLAELSNRLTGDPLDLTQIMDNY